MSKILMLTPQLPYPPHQGSSLRNYHIICGLAQRHELSLLSFVEENQSTAPASIAPLSEKCLQVYKVSVPSRSKSKRLWQLISSRQPDIAHRLSSQEFEQMLRQILVKRPFEIIQIEGIELAQYIPIVREVRPEAKIIFDAHNAETELQRRNFRTDVQTPKRLPAAIYSWIQVHRLQHYERWACCEADAVTAVSDLDARLLGDLMHNCQNEADEPQLTSNAKLPITIPNSIDTKKYQDDTISAIPFDLVFAGKMDYRPNVDAVLWFAKQVWPLIVAKRPSTNWAIIGQKPHPRLDALRGIPGITITGWVDSILPYWKGAKVAVMPFRIGSGTRLKIIEAMASGAPIVSTHIGAEGFPISSGQEAILADEAMEMADAVVSLLENNEKRRALQKNGWIFVERYDWRHVNKKFEALYQSL